jgi:hypothetical protein
MPHLSLAGRAAVAAAIVLAGSATAASAQKSSPPTAKHTPICAKAVRVYTDRAQIPTPFDTLDVPAPDGPVIVTNDQEAEAAELALRARAGSVGATAVLVTEDVEESGGDRRVRRKVTGIFVPSDSARAQQACK